MPQLTHELILASESPRRKTLLTDAGFFFSVFPVKVSENLEKNLNVDDQIISIARRKAMAGLDQYKPSKSLNYLILTADTMVVEGNQPLGKPENKEEAFQILRRLSGKKHQVKTAICLVPGHLRPEDRQNSENYICAIETTDVYFKNISDDEIQSYIATGEPMDKAGAYGIQGLGGKFVEKIVGPFDNVVGLPVDLLKKTLVKMKWMLSEPTKLLAVSKLQPTEKIRELYACGQRDFGENYVQELTEKLEQLKELEINWHFIGSLQKNKVKYLIGNVDLIHSVDSLALGEVIQKEAQKKNVTQKILIQLNLAHEETKGGIREQELPELLKKMSTLPNVAVVGLMTMPPLELDGEKVRPYFKRLREIRDQYKKMNPQLTELSMGTSNDFHIAAEEGATWVRLGTTLFGERPRRKS